ncbi:MAG: M56 family metallopeptidase [Gammaproteobacteria bacterium]
MTIAMETLTAIATFIGFASLKGTALLALVLIAQKAFSRHLSADGRYLLWLAVAISLVMPVGFEIGLPGLLFDEVVEPLQAQGAPGVEHNIVPLADGQSPMHWESVLPLVWLSGVFAVLAAMGLSSRRFSALVRNGTPAPEHLESLLRECEKQAGYTGAIRLLASAELRAPVVSGLFKPVLLWPVGLEASLTPAQVQHVLMHEVTHVKRGDIFSACIVAMLQALHWFNPAVWIAFSWLREDREMACDAATVRTLGEADAHDYAHTLIQLGAMPLAVRSRLATGLDMLDGHAQLRKRIHMLAQTADPTVRHFLSATLVLTFSALAFSQPATAPRLSIEGETGGAWTARAEIAEAAPAAVAMKSRNERELVAPLAMESRIEREPVAPQVMEFRTEREPVAPLAATAAREDEALPARRVTSVNTVTRREPEVQPVPEPPAVPVRTAPVPPLAAAPVPEPILLTSANDIDALPALVLEHELSREQDIAAPQAVLAPADAHEELTCRSVNTSGSRIRTRLCLTQTQWEAGYKVPKSAYVKNLSTLDLLDPPPLFGL